MESFGKENELFSETVLELYKNPLNFGELKNATIHAELGNPSCGDVVHVFLRIERGKIVAASFTGRGCAVSQASASLLTELVKGKTVFQAKTISSDDLFEQLGGVIQTRIKCATLSLSALKKALQNE